MKHSLKDSDVIVSAFYNRCQVPSRSVLPRTGGKPVETGRVFEAALNFSQVFSVDDSLTLILLFY